MSLEVHGELLPVGGGDAIPLIRTTMTVGRRESCDICMRFPNVSGMHCEFSFRDGYWYVRDLNSTNGIKVNGARVQEKLVYPGDEIGIGKRGYKIQYNMPAGRHAAAELEEDILTQSLLEKAGLERPKRRDQSRRGQGFDPAEFLLDED